jgi:hypothetical protein
MLPGIDALVNDSLVGMSKHFRRSVFGWGYEYVPYKALTWGAYIVGLLSSLFAYLYLRLTHPSYNTSGQYTAPTILFAFVIGLQFCGYFLVMTRLTADLRHRSTHVVLCHRSRRLYDVSLQWT